MARSTNESGVYVGLIVARSVEEPSDAALINYSVQVEDDTGVVTHEGIVPPSYYRLSTVFEVDLVPFEIGQRVPIGISRFGSTEYIDILAGELPNAGDCNG